MKKVSYKSGLMADHNPTLYKWDRFTKPRTYSRSQRVTTGNDVQNWIKKVEEASNRAAAETFGPKYGAPSGGGRATALAKVEDIRLHDAAYAEAQELLNDWVSTKIHLDDDDDDDDYLEERSHHAPSQAQVKKEWDHLLEEIGEDSYKTDTDSLTARKAKLDIYNNLDVDDDGAVDDFLDNLLQKQLVDNYVTDDLGLEEPAPRKDPRIKMELRHKQVKENREKREKELQRKRREQQAKKYAQHQAKQIVLKEEKAKVARKKHEEQELQREMAHIRKEMEEERRKQQEQRHRERQEREALAVQTEREMMERETKRAEEQRKKHRSHQERQLNVMKKMKEIEAREVADNLKLLHRCFSSWYGLVVEHRLRLGKAQALADWRCLLHAWNGWRGYVRRKRLAREARHEEQQIKENHRKSQLAEEHHRRTVLRNYFSAWYLWMKQQEMERQSACNHISTRNRMAAFLEAAATGQLWGKPSEGDGESSTIVGSQAQVDALFEDAPKRQHPPDSARSATSSVVTERDVARQHIPTEPWQVTRRHLKLTKKEIASLGSGDDPAQVVTPSSANSDGRSRSHRNGPKPWEKTPFKAKTHEHRYEAQQKILQEQQKQIAEQRRLIEELRFAQGQQQLQQDANMQEMIRQHLEKLSVMENAVSLQQGAALASGTDDHHQGAPPVSGTGQGSSGEQSPDSRSEASTRHEKGDGDSRRKTVQHNSPRSQDGLSTARSESSSVSKTSDSSKHTKFLKAMEDRAAQRARIKKEREDRRRQADAEKLAALEAEQEAKRQQEEEEKRAKQEAYREKKRLERQKEEEKQRQLEQMRQKMREAEEHYTFAVMKFRGWRPWQRLVEMAHENEAKAESHYIQTIMRKCFCGWSGHTQEVTSQRNQMADDMHSFLILRRCFSSWRKYKHVMLISGEKAKLHHQKVLVQRVFRTWQVYAEEEKFASWEKERKARKHSLIRIQKRCFRAWHRFPQIVQQGQEKERRLLEMRRRVASMLPDFEGLSSVKPDDSVDIS